MTAQSFQGVPWQVTPDRSLFLVSVEVTTRNQTRSDGTLDPANQADDFGLSSTGTSGIFQGVSHHGGARWTNHPGTYYWQLSGLSFAPTTGPCLMYISPVCTITVAAPARPTPSIGPEDGGRFARRIVGQRTGRHPRIATSCTQGDPVTIRCRLRWSAGGFAWSASGRFTSYVGPDGSNMVGYDFRGARYPERVFGRSVQSSPLAKVSFPDGA